MRAAGKCFVLLPLLTLFLCLGSVAQQAGRIESMKLLTPDVGWAATNKKLFWTTNGGSQWKDITPKLNHKRQMISSVFFLDSSAGWVLLSCGDDKSPKADDVCFEFASTTDAGENWTVVHPEVVDSVPQTDYNDWTGYSGAAFLDFADSQHGWAILRRSLPVGRSSGEMLRTVDGGHTWTQLAKGTLPMAEHFRFVNAKDGWIAGGPDQRLYVTHDGGNLWQEVPWPQPTGVGPDTGVRYGLPVFESERHGFLLAQYQVGPLTGPDLATLVLFATDDGGKTWRQDRTLSRLPDIHSSDVADSVLIATHSEQKKEGQNGTVTTALSLFTLGPDRSVVRNTSEVSSQGAATQLSFVGRDQGWANLSDRLFATRDAGKTWVDVTPGGARPSSMPAIQSPAKTAPTQGMSIPQSTSSDQPASGNSVSTHLGFDSYNVPTVSQMSAWMTSSPFYDVFIYLPHSPNRHNDPILVSKNGPGWVSSVEGQGWGLAPIWFGLQSTCVNDSSGITQFISTTPATASTQGAEQADSAVAQDKLLGVTGGIIYLDIESYTTGGACSIAVQSYVDGFVSEIGTYGGYSAGVYANPPPIKTDISQVSPAPSAIWITKTPPKTNPIPSVSVWNQGIPDSSTTNSMYWPNGQRMHQFLFNTSANNAPNATWGGVSLSIDYDIDNGPGGKCQQWRQILLYSDVQ